MNKAVLVVLFLIGALAAYTYYPKLTNQTPSQLAKSVTDELNLQDGILESLNPLTIDSLRNGKYPGSELKIEETLAPGSNYQRYLTSYQSEGNKIYALLTIPNGDVPKDGFPVVVFNHGYIQPAEYRTTERYIAYTDAFSRNGYVLLRPDYRGHGSSEGRAEGGYGSNAYTIDVLNAVSSIKKLGVNVKGEGGRISNDLTLNALPFPLVNPNRIGMWGHSMGGHITLRNMVTNKDVKAGVIWAGVVASYPDLLNNWRRSTFTPPPLPSGARRWRQTLIEEYGTPEKNPSFWASISANTYLKDISGPLQLHHGTEDTSVPVVFSQKLEKQMKEAGKEVELYVYEGDDHNLGNNLSLALQRSVEFFDKNLKD